MPNQIRDYFYLLGVGATSADPTIPFDNEFHLLGLDESESNQQIAQKARTVATTRAQEVDRRGQAHPNKRLDILLRDKINQAGILFDGKPAKVAEHREELHRLRERRLKDIAKDLGDSGKWTATQATDMLETIASSIGIVSDPETPNRLQKAVADAVQSVRWIGSAPTPSPAPPNPAPLGSGEVFVIGRWKIPLWRLILAIGLVVGLINVWAGLAFGIAFLILAWGRANAERKPGGSVTTPHLRRGAIHAAVASAPLVVMLAFGSWFFPSINLSTQAPLLALLTFGPAAGAADAKWAGEWETDWGKMTFTVKANRVTAAYESRTGGGQIDLKATNERQLDGSWCRPSCASPNDTGHLQLVLDDSGQSFKGWYTDGLDSEIKQSDDPAYQVNGRRRAK